MSRISYVSFPAIPQVWTLDGWATWATLMIAAVGDQFTAIRRDAQLKAFPVELTAATVAQLTTDVPPLYRPAPDGKMVFCSDAVGGGVPVYSRAGAWRRFDTNAIVT